MKYVVFRDISDDGVFYNDLEVYEIIPSFEALQQTFPQTNFTDTSILSTDTGTFVTSSEMLQATAGGVFTGALDESGNPFRRYDSWTFIPNAETDLLNAPQSALYPNYNNTLIQSFREPSTPTDYVIRPGQGNRYEEPASVLFAGSISHVGGYTVQQVSIDYLPKSTVEITSTDVGVRNFWYPRFEPSASSELSDQFDFSFDIDIDGTKVQDGVYSRFSVDNPEFSDINFEYPRLWEEPWTVSPDQQIDVPEQLQPKSGVVGVPTMMWDQSFRLNLDIADLFTQYALGDTTALDDFSVSYIGNKATESSFQTFSWRNDGAYGIQPITYEEVSILLNFSFSNVEQLDWVIPDNDGFVTLNPLAERLFLDESPNYYGILTGTTPQITIDTGVSAKIFDATGDHSLSIENGASMHFAGAQGHNEFYFDSYSDEWFVRRDGSVIILDSGFDIVEIPVTLDYQTLIFADNVYEISIDTSAQSVDQLVSVYMDLGSAGLSKMTTLDLISGARLPQRDSDLTAENSPYHFEVYQDQTDSSVWNLDFQWSPEQSPNAVYEISYDISFEAGSIDASSIVYDLNVFDHYGDEELFTKTQAFISDVTTDAISNISTFTFTGGYLFNNPDQPQSRIGEANGGTFQFTALTENPVVTISNIHVNELDMELPSSTLVLGENLGAELDAYQGTMQQPYELNLATLGHGQVIEDDISTESYTRLTNVNFAWDGSSITTPENDDDGFMTTLDLADHGGWTVQSSEGLVTLAYNNNGIISEIVIEADHVSSSDVLYSLSDLIDIGIEVVGLTSTESNTISGYTSAQTEETSIAVLDTSISSTIDDYSEMEEWGIAYNAWDNGETIDLDLQNSTVVLKDDYMRNNSTRLINFEFAEDANGDVVAVSNDADNAYTTLSLVSSNYDRWGAYSPESGVLSIFHFYVDPDSDDDISSYTNSLWQRYSELILEAPHLDGYTRTGVLGEDLVNDLALLGIHVIYDDSQYLP